MKIRFISQEPSLFAHIIHVYIIHQYESKGSLKQKKKKKEKKIYFHCEAAHACLKDYKTWDTTAPFPVRRQIHRRFTCRKWNCHPRVGYHRHYHSYNWHQFHQHSHLLLHMHTYHVPYCLPSLQNKIRQIKKKMSSFKSNENIHKKEDESYYVVSANEASSVTLLWPGNESQRKRTAILRISNRQSINRLI